MDGGPRARDLRRRAAGPGRAERRGDPAAAHLHHGSDLGDRDAVLHLLGRAVRRGDHLDPVQHPGRGLVGGDDFRRLSDGAAGQGGGGADRRLHLLVHRLAGRGAAHHLSRARHRLVRVALRASRVLRRLLTHFLLLRGPGPRGKAQDDHLDVSRPSAHRHRHGRATRRSNSSSRSASTTRPRSSPPSPLAKKSRCTEKGTLSTCAAARTCPRPAS